MFQWGWGCFSDEEGFISKWGWALVLIGGILKKIVGRGGGHPPMLFPTMGNPNIYIYIYIYIYIHIYDLASTEIYETLLNF